MGILEGHEEAGGGTSRVSWRHGEPNRETVGILEGHGEADGGSSRISWRPEEAGGGALGGARVGAEWGLGQ
jgi:hypothetical protein